MFACAGNPVVTDVFPSQKINNAELVSRHDIIMIDAGLLVSVFRLILSSKYHIIGRYHVGQCVYGIIWLAKHIRSHPRIHIRNTIMCHDVCGLTRIMANMISCNSRETRQNTTQSVGNMPPPSPRHLLPHVLQIMPRNPKYDQFQPKGHHNEENPQSTTKMHGNSKFEPFH